jgi:hypothetical protein
MLLIENPHHRAQLYAMGLRPETIFGCAMDFLLRPNEALFDMFNDELQVLSNKKALKIGIQIRIPFDTILDGRGPDNFTLEEYSSFYDCAEVSSSAQCSASAREAIGPQPQINVAPA